MDASVIQFLKRAYLDYLDLERHPKGGWMICGAFAEDFSNPWTNLSKNHPEIQGLTIEKYILDYVLEKEAALEGIRVETIQVNFRENSLIFFEADETEHSYTLCEDI
ncbi:MAG: hypothetical protein OEY01_03565 [Desulfobulbaceae bacterium]|nr:hypothetical protein [Desulfobulbaceae bacterium]